jgi:TonB-dependent starch-binding outer membrane protein SusC
MKITVCFKSRSAKAGLLTKTLLVMRLTAALLLITCLQLTASEGRAQQFNLSEKNVPLEKIFKEIRKQTGYQIFYKNELLKNIPRLDVDLKNASIQEVLDFCLRGQGLTYAILDHNIVIKPREPEQLTPAVTVPSFDVGGIVKDEKGHPMQGVTIKCKHTNGTVTDAEGKFSISATTGDILTFSHIGYSSRQYKVTEGQAIIQVSMQIEPAQLNESVIIGYGSQERRSLTGSVGSYKPSDEIGQLPLSVDEAMVGKIAGVLVSPSSGVPGSATAITIRGISTLNTNGNSPLIVVDGVPIYGIDQTLNTADFSVGNVPQVGFGGTNVDHNYSQPSTFEKNPLATINPDDIESIEVLKDAFSTAIYGSRGAAGVILITTKKGQAGKMKINADFSTSASHFIKLPDLMNGNQYAGFYTAFYHDMDSLNAIGNPYYTPLNYKFPVGINTNWLRASTRTAVSDDANIAISGGNDRGSSYYLSGGYLGQQSPVINMNYTRYNTRIRFDQKVTGGFSIGTDLNLTYADNNALNAQEIFRAAVLKAPNQPIYNADGSYNWGQGTNPIAPQSDLNPVGTARTDQNHSIDTRTLGNIYGQLKLNPWLTLRSEFGVDWLNSDAYMRESNKPNTPGGFGNETLQFLRKWVVNNTLTVNKTLGIKQTLNGVVGQSFETSTENTSSIWGRDFLNDQIYSITAASETGVQNALEQQWAMISYFTRMNYAYDQKYLFGVTYRLDGSSKFAENHRYVGFPSFSAGWVVNRESFMKELNFIDQFKLRSSLGFSGTDGGGGYYGNQGQYVLNVYGSTYAGQPVINVSQPSNPNLVWEKTQTYDFGTDIALWNSRLTLTFDYYNKHINNAILPSAIPAYLGFTTQVQNLAELNNRGVEFTLNTQNIRHKDFQWNTSFNIARNRDMIERLHKVDAEDLAQQIEYDGGRYWLAGQSATEFYMYKWVGVNPQDGNPLWGSTNGKNQETPFPADPSYANNYLTQRVPMGDAMPKFFGGMDNNFIWKGWELDVFFSFSYGNKMFNGAKATLYNYTQSTSQDAQVNNLSPELLNYWRTPGQITNIPALINASNSYGSGFFGSTDYTLGTDISRFLEDASFLKLRNITLAYHVDKKFIRRLKYFNGIKVYIQATNVFILTKYSGLDPEVSAFGSSALNSGYDELTIPNPRTFTAGVKVDL